MTERLADRLSVPGLVPAVALELPPHKGRESRMAVYDAPCASHTLDVVTVEGVRHPLAAADAPAYRLFRAVPKGIAPTGGWPVLYMLDGNAAFDFLTAELLACVPGLVVIGVGHETQAQFERTSRARDLTFPATGQAGLVPDPLYGDRPAGGGPQFMALLGGRLRALAEAGLPIDPARRTLWGHSLGGLFVLQMMLRDPGAFARYAAISPSLWWHPERLAALLDAALAGPERAVVPLYLGSGNRERRTGSGEAEPTDAPASFHALIARFEASGRFDLLHQVYDGAVHIASLPSSLATSLRFAAL